MQLSQYLKAWPSPQHPGYLLLFSTRQASLALVPEKVYADLQSGVVDEEFRESLIELGMLVPDLAQERDQIFDFLNEINRLHPAVDLAIILGLECNFACTYCYEGSLKGKSVMTDEVIDGLIAFAKSRLGAYKKKLVLDFYGGEPLLYVQRIKKIAGPLKAWCGEQGIAFHFSLVTNGSLLTPVVVEGLIPYGLKVAKVTMDGPALVHDLCRPFKSGRPSFSVIMNNVKECCDLIKVSVGGNFSRDNFHDFPLLLDCLAEEGLDPDRLGSMQFSPVSQTADQYANQEYTGGCSSCNEPWVAEATLLIREESMKRGYKTPKIGPSPCMVDINDAMTINYDGRIFKCVAMIGHPRMAVGNLWQGVGDFSRTYDLGHWQRDERCRECTYLPLCFGGCRDMNFQRHGYIAGVECRKEFYDRTLETTIKQDVTYRYG